MSRSIPTLLLVAALVVRPAPACEHLPRDYTGSLEQTGQEAIVFWKAGREILVLKNDFRIEPGEGGELPSHLAWVIPVPSAPDDYSVEDVEVFRAMFDAWDEANRARTKGMDNGPPKREELEFLAKVDVGEYEIQPIRARGEEGARALGDWLDANGFGRVPAENMAWYVGRGWVWLAVKVDLAQGAESIVRNGSLRPLSLSFASEDVVYPVLVNQGQGAFDVNLYLVTEPDFDVANESVRRYGFIRKGSLPLALPEAVAAIQDRAVRTGRFEAIARPVVHKLVAHGLGGPHNPIAGWTDDFRISDAGR